MTRSDRDVDDALFARLREVYDDDALIELTALIAWENASSRFNRALRVPSQHLWRPDPDIAPNNGTDEPARARPGSESR